MAGIGFNLRRILEEETYWSVLKAYAFSGVISCGPWALTILSIVFLGLLAQLQLSVGQMVVFYVTVTYIFAYSLILTGPVQLVLTRYLSDCLFLREREKVFPTYVQVLSVVTPVQGILGTLAFCLLDVPWPYRLAGIALYVLVSNIWLTMIFLTAVKAYGQIVLAFLAGTALSVAAGFVCSRISGLSGLLFGCMLGYALLFFWLLGIIFVEFGQSRLAPVSLGKAFRSYPALIFIGLSYNVAIWVDKLIFWYAPETGQQVRGFLYASQIYDPPIFLAYLSIIPGMAYFLMKLETSYAEAHAAYYNAILNRRTLAEIEGWRLEMVDAFRQGFVTLIKIQGAVAGLLLFFAEPLLRHLGLNWIHIPLFRVDVIGVFVQLMVTCLLIGLFYLDERRTVLFLSLLYLGANAAGSLVSIRLGVTAYGYGFAVAGLLTMAAALVCLDRHFRALTYTTFVQQPIHQE